LRFHSRGFLGCDPKHEVIREAGDVPAYGLIETAGAHTVERGEILVEEHPDAAYEVDAVFDGGRDPRHRE